MTYLLRHLLNDGIQTSDATTFPLDLPTMGKLHTLLVRCATTNGATSGRSVSIFDSIDLIEIIGDGGEVIYTLTPVEIEKWIETLTGKNLEVIQTEAASGVQSVVLPLMFGRSFYDKEMWLPLDAHKQTQLKITYSPTIAADAGFATGTVTFDVTALITPQGENLPYLGTLSTRRIKDFTSVASGDDATDLPLKFPIRAIGVYAYEAATDDGTDVTRVQLGDDTSVNNLFDQDWPDFLDYNRNLFGAEIFHTARLLQTDAEVWNCRIGYLRQVVLEPIYSPSDANDTFSTFNASAYTGDRVTIQIRDADITAGAETFAVATADYRIQATAFGKSPSFFGLIPYLMDDTPQGYLQAQLYSKLRLLLTQGGAGATVRVSVQELKQYHH